MLLSGRVSSVTSTEYRYRDSQKEATRIASIHSHSTTTTNRWVELAKAINNRMVIRRAFGEISEVYSEEAASSIVDSCFNVTTTTNTYHSHGKRHCLLYRRFFYIAPFSKVPMRQLVLATGGKKQIQSIKRYK